jgi:hypothetical protein
MHFQLLFSDGKNRNKTKMKIRSVCYDFPVEGFAGITNMLCINPPPYPGYSLTKNEKHIESGFLKNIPAAV